MSKNKIENPLKSIETQMERILFENINVKADNANKNDKIIAPQNLNRTDLKKHLLNLIKELKAKTFCLVA